MDQTLEKKDDDTYSHMYNLQPRSLQDCFDMFAEIPKCVDDKIALQRITKEALEDFAKHNVAYLELRSTPKILKHMTKTSYIETILDTLKDFEALEEKRYHSEMMENAKNNNNTLVKLPMKCRFLVSIDRGASVQEAEESVALAIDFFQKPDSYIVGVDIGGNPTKNDFRDFQPAVTKARNAGLKVTVHCAEVPVGESDQEEDPKLLKSFQEVKAVFQFRPDRIGHALLLPPSLRDILTNQLRIPVESCPTSNVMTLELAKHMGGSLVHGLQQHPQLKHWLESDFPISIGTDDPGVFDTNATKEILLLAHAWQVLPRQLQRIVLGSLDHAFCHEELKDSIRQRMLETFDKITKPEA